MATEASFTVPASEFPLNGLFESFPDARIELERLVPMECGMVPYIWVRGAETTAVEIDQAGDAGVRDVHVVDTVEGDSLLHVDWSLDGNTSLFDTLHEMDLPVVNAVGTRRHWRFDVRGDAQADIASFQERCRERQIPIHVTSVTQLTARGTTLDSALTDAQRRAVVLAHGRGYFEFPRDVTMEELGAELGISQQAFANRLWRGIDQILDHTLDQPDL